MEGVKIDTDLSKIPNLTFEGYVWLSDEKSPVVLQQETYDFSAVRSNPFVIEALLYNKENNVSIHVQHNGSYQIAEYDLGLLEKSGATFEEKQYLPHRLENIGKVNFKQIWLPEEDENCEGMEVLTLKATVFCGFNKTKNHE
jgi:CRISPR type III-associated protein (TIGR04423 family)